MALLLNVKSWCRFSLLLLLIFELNEFAQACDCPGTTAQVSGQNFCFEIQHTASNATWSNADQTCLSLGGFLAHLDSSSLISNLKSYVQANYQRPLLTGGLLGNAEYQLIALMCPNNSFMGLLNTTIASEIISGNASASSGSCLFLETTDYKLHYDNCNITFDILCQIPMDNTQTCGVMMQCSNSTNSSTTTTTTALSTTIFTSTMPTSRTSSTNTSQRIESSSVTTPRTSSVTPTTHSSASNGQSTTKNVQPIISSSSITTSKVSSSNSSSTTPSSSILMANNNNNSNGTTTATSNLNQSTTTSSANQSTYSTVSSFLSSISTLASNLTTTIPSSNWTTPISNSTAWPVNSSNAYPTDSSSDGCDSGYTTLGSWCLPWWAWLVFGGLLFLVLLTLALCCVIVCVGRQKKKAVASENYEKLSDSGANNDYAGKQVRPSSEPPGSIYDNKAGNDYLAPAPYSAPTNNAPVYI